MRFNQSFHHRNYRKGGNSPGRHHLLELNVRAASLQRQRREKAGGVLWKIFAVTTVLTLSIVAADIGAQKFIFRNPEFSLRHLDAQLDGVMTQDELVALTGLNEGKNLFQIDLDQIQRRLSALPEVRTVTLERIQPDTIKVKIERRLPVFLFAGNGDAGDSFVSGRSFLCDREGFLMQPSRMDPEFLNLPVLRGVDPGNTQPGIRLDNDRLAYAIRLDEALLEIPEVNFRIRSVDVSREYAAVVTDDSNARYTFGNEDLPGQLERLRELIAHCQETGRQIDTANLMVTRNTPVTFVPTPEEESAKIVPVSPAKKGVRR